MFGEFSIHNEYSHFTHINNKSLQIARLLAYLIANKDTEVSKDKLIDILWPEENASNPSGALRNLIYRARQILAKFFPEGSAGDAPADGTEAAPAVECILFSKNAYRWNPDINCVIDIYEFEHYANLAEKEHNPDEQYDWYCKAHSVYTGDFLNILAADEWVVFRSVYYKNLYTKITVNMCRYLGHQQNYTAVIRLCESSSLVDQMDEQIHVEKIYAYLKMNTPSQAMAYYYSISDLFTQKFGIDLGPEMKKAYREIIRQLPNYHQDIGGLEENLRTGNEDKGTFYCNFDIFKNIYQINLRSVRRSQSKRYLTLFTLTDTSSADEITSDLIEEMDNVYALLSKNLRSNDVFTKSSPSQFSLILTVANEAGCKTAIERITSRYAKKKLHDHIQLQVAYKLIQ